MSIRNLVENQSNLNFKELTTSLIAEFGITDTVNWDAVIPANVQQNLFGGETLRLFEDHPNFASQKDIRTIALKKGNTSQLLILFARLKDEKLSKTNIEKVTKKFIGGSAAERFVVWFFGNPSDTVFKVVLSGKEGKKIVLKTLPFGVEQPYYKTYDFILYEVHKKVSRLFVEPNELWKALWKSFDISVVNKKFYLDIKAAFDSLINNAVFKGSIRIEEARKQFAVRLIGRIIFCWFLKKKNIVADSVLSSNAVPKYEDYYFEFLEKLFFEVFNTPQKERIKLPDEIKDYPFLNGGLFEDQKGDFGDYKQKVFIENNWFLELFKNTLEKYNFTIDENTSSSSEIAIDPEMLGRIFENLLAEQNPETQESARKSTGSYYTPREIVDYMVEQSVSEYLKSNVTLSEVEASLIEDFVHTEELPEELKPYTEQLLSKLNTVKVLDPACGSGAFPIGMLQKLIALKLQLSPFAKGGNTKGVYDLKLQTILTSIYGCDIQPMAVELSRLRCWLSLIIDEPVDKKKYNWGIENLPNLDFKFVCVNTLISLPKMVEDSLGTSADDFENLKQLRTEFFSASAKRKIKIEEEFKSLQDNIAEKQREWSTKNTEAVTLLINWNPFKVDKTDWFDPFWMFGVNSGFEIVIGNPPYLNVELVPSTIKELYRKFYSTIHKRYDVFGLFFETSLLNYVKKGIITFIIPSQIMNNLSFSKLRDLILKNRWLHEVCYLGDKIFEAANNDVCIFILKKPAIEKIKLVDALNFDNKITSVVPTNYFEKFNNIISANSSAVSDSIFTKMYGSNNFRLRQVFDVFQGIVTGNNDVFILDDDTIAKHKIEEELLHPVLHGRDFGKWLIRNTDRKILYVTSDTQILKYNNSYKWLEKYRASLKLRRECAKGVIEWYSLQWPRVKSQLDYTPKIIVQGTRNPRLETRIVATIDDIGIYGSQGLNFIVPSDKKNTSSVFYLVALLNSKPINYLFKTKFLNVAIKAEYLKDIPIPVTDDKIKDRFIDVVTKILERKEINSKAKTKELEDQIDIMVYKLYKLTYEEVKIIDPEIEKIISKEVYEKFSL